MDLSKVINGFRQLLHLFLKIDILDLSEWLYGFVKVAKWICQWWPVEFYTSQHLYIIR